VSGGEIAFVGDVHLDADDPELDAFCRFLERLGQRVSRIVLLGDLFNLWIGDRRLEQPHQRAVVETLAGLRRRGRVVRYVEGNRDYRIGPAYAGLAFDDVATAGLVERQGAQTLFAIHGDLTNPHDRRYRAWRRISRTPAAWLVLAALPPRRRLRLAERLEARMRRTNTAFKRELPEPELSAYARRWLDRGHDAVVLGHFHVERDIALERGRLVVLPDWKAGRRWLHVDAAGRLAFAGPETS
jgi:UDP-2,3-diacylglucosamine hydrolase